MKKKILAVIIMFVLMITTLTNTYAADGMMHFGAFQTAYRLSQEADIDLPFANFFEKGATYDELVSHSGISFGQSTIDVDEKMEGMHLILAQDMVTIKGEVEHGIIYGTNIVVEGKISDDTILMAETIKILDTAVIERDLIVVTTDLTMDGLVKGNLIGAVSSAVISGTIEQDLRIEASQIELEKSTIKDEVYLSVPAGVDVSKITTKYPSAVISEIVQVAEEEDVKLTGEEIAKIALTGAKFVIVYTIVAMLLTKKETNVATKMTARFLENSTFGIFAAVGMFALSILAIVLLVILGCMGYGVIAWPILIVYLGVLLLSLSICQFVVGVVVYEMLKKKIGKYKIPALIGIFAVVYALTELPYIAPYMVIAINIMSLGVIMTYIFKRTETSEFINIEESNNEEIKEDKKEEPKEEVKEDKKEDETK